MTKQKGYKADKGKVRLSLIPIEAITGMGEVLTFGAKKYTENGWKLVPNAKIRYTDAAFRHLIAYVNGEVLDSESGLSHLKHLLANVAFLLYFEEKGRNDKL